MRAELAYVFETPLIRRAFVVGGYMVSHASERHLRELRDAHELSPLARRGYTQARADAHAHGLLTAGEAQVVQQVIDGWDNARLADRIAVTLIVGSWLNSRRAAEILHRFEYVH